jgi:hypothetical protein
VNFITGTDTTFSPKLLFSIKLRAKMADFAGCGVPQHFP